MVSFSWRSLMASALSLWLGVLACLLGCAKPAFAVSTEQTQSADLGVCPERDRGAADSCCQHSHSGGSEKNSQHFKSCCPTETALTQKNDLASQPLVAVHIATLTLPNCDVADLSLLTENADVLALRPSGREILKQVHVLRI